MSNYDSEYIELSKSHGLKPYLMYGLLDIKRSDFEIWVLKVFPERGGRDYSVYELLVLMLVKQYITKYGTDKKILWGLEWRSIMSFFSEKGIKDLANYIFNINVETREYGFFKSINDFKHSDGRNRHVPMQHFINEILNAIFSIGLGCIPKNDEK